MLTKGSSSFIIKRLKRAMSYRYQGRCFLITWSQVDATVDHLQCFTLVEEFARIRRCVIAREHHLDGGVHYHMYVEHEQYVDRRVSDLLSLAGRHPNIAKKSTPEAQKAAAEYCRKETDWVEYGFDQDDTLEVSITELAKQYPTWVSWLDHCHLHKIPYMYASASWNAVQTSDLDILEGTPCTGSITDLRLLLRVFNPTTDRSLVLLGPSGTGKTTWAKTFCPKPALFCSHIDDLKKFQPGYHQCVIFDDMDFRAWPRTSQIHLVDWFDPRSIHIRYSTVRIPALTFKIFTCNMFPFIEDPAIRRRIELLDLYI